MNIGVLKTLIPPPERRTEPEIEADLDDEIAFHIAQIERELLEEGATADEARAGAIARFGNVEKIKKRCKRIALEERIMLQRINAVLMVIVLIAVAFVSVQVYLTQRHNSVALLDISSQITKMRMDAAVEARDRGWAAPVAEPSQGLIYIGGAVKRPGTYELPGEGRLSLRRTLAASGGVDATEETAAQATIALLRRDASGVQRPVFEGTLTHLRESDEDPLLQSEDLIVVTLPRIDFSARAEERVLVEGDVERPGWYTIEMNNGATYVHEVLERAGGITDQNRVEHFRAGYRISRPWYQGETLLGQQPRKIVLHPTDRLLVHSPPRPEPKVELPTTARVLVTGHIEDPEWREIPLDEPTYVHEMLNRVGARPEQWVRHLHRGQSGIPPTIQVQSYVEEHRNALLRPDDQLHIFDRASNFERQDAIDVFWQHDRRSLMQVDETGVPIPDGWRLTGMIWAGGGGLGSGGGRADNSWHRFIYATLSKPGTARTANLYLKPDGVNLLLRSGPARAEPIVGDWEYGDGVLTIDLTGAEAALAALERSHLFALPEALAGWTQPLRFSAAVFVSGDVEHPGWQPLALEEDWSVRAMLMRAGARAEQSVKHRRHSEPVASEAVPVESYFEGQREGILHPGDQLHISDTADEVDSDEH